MKRGRISLLLALLATLAGAAAAFGRTDAVAPARILFASNATPVFGEHMDVVSVDRAGRPKRVGDLGPGTFAVPSPDGRKVVFLGRDPGVDGQLYVMNVDGSNRRRLTDDPDQGYVAALPLVWSPDGRLIAFTGIGPKIGIVAADGSSRHDIETEYAESPAWSPDGRTIAYTTQPGGLFLAERDGTRPRRIGPSASAPQWAPRGRRLAVVRNRGIWIVDADSGRATRVKHGALEAFTPVWSPDGKRLAFIGSSDRTTELWTVELATGSLQKLTGALGGRYDVDTPSWSPNGRWLAFASERGFLRIVSAERPGTIRALASWPPRRAAGRPSWLPDGRVLLSTRVSENDREIFVANADGSGVRALTQNRVPDFQPAGSPDGRWIAYVSAKPGGGKRTIYVIRSDGRAKRRLLAAGFPSQNTPAWSPRRGEIAFESRGFIYLVAATGGTPRQLVRGLDPAWASDGRALAFQGFFENNPGSIWLINRDGTGLRPAPGFRLPSLAPDGARVAFQKPVSNVQNGIFVAELATGTERLLAPGRDPAWSPDGASIAFDRRFSIWTIPSGGGEARRVTTLNGTAEHASWLPAAAP